MTFKIYRQFGSPNAPVKELIRNTQFLFFNKKTGRHGWHIVQYLAGGIVPNHCHEVEFESWEQVNELIHYHPEVNTHRIMGRGFPFIGDRKNLVIGKTDKWIV